MTKEMDIRNTIFRKILSYGLRHGQRINSVSMAAEGWYWYMTAAADDYGNLPGEPYLCRIQAAPRRRNLTDEEVEGWCRELCEATADDGTHPLLLSYVGPDREAYLHIVDFTHIQKAPNGRRARKYPSCPWESEDGQPRPGDTPGADRSDPEPPGAPPEVPGGTRANQGEPGGAGAAAPPPDSEPISDQDLRSEARATARPPTTPPRRDLSAQGGSGGGNGTGRVGSGGANGTETERRIATARTLERLGVTPGVSAQLSAFEGLTPEIVNRTHQAIVEEGGAHNPISVLVARVRKRRWA